MTPPNLSKGPMLSIAVQKDLVLGVWFVTRVDLETGVIKNQTRFKVPVPVDQAFSRPFLDIVEPVLPAHPQSNLFVDNTAQFTLPSLTLSGIRVVAQRAFGGVQTVVVRFRQALGSVHSLYTPEYRITRLSGSDGQPALPA